MQRTAHGCRTWCLVFGEHRLCITFGSHPFHQLQCQVIWYQGNFMISLVVCRPWCTQCVNFRWHQSWRFFLHGLLGLPGSFGLVPDQTKGVALAGIWRQRGLGWKGIKNTSPHPSLDSQPENSGDGQKLVKRVFLYFEMGFGAPQKKKAIFDLWSEGLGLFFWCGASEGSVH